MPIANWYPDPADPTRVRWWDGESWTEHTQPRPAPVIDPSSMRAPASYEQYAMPSAFAPDALPGNAVGSISTPVQLRDGKAVVPAVYVTGGWVPDTCTRHDRPAAGTRKVTFVSKTPAWTYLLLLLGILMFVIVASVMSKKATSPAWPLCEDCLATRRRNMALVWIGILGIVPLLVLANMLDGGHGSGVAGFLMVVALLGLPILAVTGGILGAWARIVGGVVTADGLYVAFPPEQLRRSLAPATSGVGAGRHTAGPETLPS